MSDDSDKALATLQRANASIRKALLANFPPAFEQYVCLSLPGTVIDTTEGGSYLPASTGMTADQRNAINCNEAMLVDTMLPLDKVVLGPTGKSVTRSYFTSLDMLVPRKTDVGTFDLSGGAAQVVNSQEYKYTLAMDYLRRAAPGATRNSTNDNNVKGSKAKLMERGVPATTVDLYVEKQLKWSSARAKWDAARNEAIGRWFEKTCIKNARITDNQWKEARESRPDNQSASAFSLRQKKLKSAQSELHARWMGRVVNGDKLKIDYCFALVDRDSIMARIERAKEATRDAMLTSIDGTEWAQVHLEPATWGPALPRQSNSVAHETPGSSCAFTATTRKPSFHEGSVQCQLRQRAESGRPEPGTTPPFDLDKAAVPKEEPPSITNTDESIKLVDDAKLKEAYKNWVSAKEKGDAGAIKQAQWRLAAREDDKWLNEVIKANGGDKATAENKLQKAEAELRAALKALYDLERTFMPGPKVTLNSEKLIEAKTRVINAKVALKEAQTDESTVQLSASGAANLRTSIKGRRVSLESEIQRLEGRLTLNNPPDMIVGLEGDERQPGSVLKSRATTVPDGGTGEGDAATADVWTNIAFTVAAQTTDHKQDEHGMAGAFHAQAQSWSWWALVKAESSFSKNDRHVSDFVSKCTVSGSFSAMVVNVKRPWLHAELYQDFDIDIPAGTFLSPGARTIKYWIDTGNDEFGVYKREDYGKFPAYPTAFIVAADAHLSFKSNGPDAKETLNVLQTDSSVEASFGCWAFGGGAGAKLNTSDKSSNQHMEVKDGALEISFQPPQIIGWVSEVLPELPRGDKPKEGGLNGAPIRGYRSNL